MRPTLLKLAHELDRRHPEILAEWMAQILERSWNLGHAARLARGEEAPVEADGAGQILRQRPAEVLALLEERCGQFLRALARGVGTVDHLAVGSPELREPIQILSFASGWMAGVGLGVSDVLVLVHGLEAVIDELPPTFFQSIQLAVCEAHRAAVAQEHQALYRDAMERAQVVCDLGGDTPCLFLVGDPDRQALDSAISRVMTLAVMRGASRLLVDCATLARPERTMPEAMAILLDYAKELPLALAVSGLDEEISSPLALLKESGVTIHADIAGALAAR